MTTIATPEARIRALGGRKERHAPQRANGDDCEDPRPTPPDVTGPALIAARLDPTPIEKIPPRPWTYGRFLLFGSAAVIGAVDGGGKGAIAVVMALAMITGRLLLGERVWRTGPVAIVTYEDDETEWHRRGRMHPLQTRLSNRVGQYSLHPQARRTCVVRDAAARPRDLPGQRADHREIKGRQGGALDRGPVQSRA
jgi:hypothetical protein